MRKLRHEQSQTMRSPLVNERGGFKSIICIAFRFGRRGCLARDACCIESRISKTAKKHEGGAIDEAEEGMPASCQVSMATSLLL